MLTRLKQLIMATTLLWLSGCAASVQTDFNEQFDFSSLKHYLIRIDDQQSSGNPLLDGPLVQQRMLRSLNAVLKEKGYSPDEQPDFIVTYLLKNKREVESRSGMGYGVGFVGGAMGFGISSGGGVTVYNKALLTISIYDARDPSLLLWRGMSEKRLSKGDTSAEDMDKLIHGVVANILSHFPPEK